MKRYYAGPHRAVELVLDGTTHKVAHGDAIDVPAGTTLGPDWVDKRPARAGATTAIEPPADAGDETPAEAGSSEED